MTTETFTQINSNRSFDVDLYGFKKWFVKQYNLDPEIDIDMESTTMSVQWEFYIEMRSWGVKTIGAYATKVEMSILVEYYDQEDKKHEYEIEEKVMQTFLEEFEIESNSEHADGQFTINNVEVDFDDKKIQVNF